MDLKLSLRKTLLGFVGTSLGMYMMVAPLASTVSADPMDNQPVQTQVEHQKASHQHHLRHGKFSKENMEKHIRSCHIQHRYDKFFTLNPVEIVKFCADELGFDAQEDTFTLISENQTTAIVQVLHDDSFYNIILTQAHNGQWIVESMK